jgi:hypothetical protein
MLWRSKGHRFRNPCVNVCVQMVGVPDKHNNKAPQA